MSEEIAALLPQVQRLEALLALALSTARNSAAKAPPTTFVFRPGGVASGNVYTSWAALVTACALVVGPRTIEFDPSGGGALTIPAGPWDLKSLGDVMLVGVQKYPGVTSNPTVTINGTFVTPPAGHQFLNIIYAGAGAPGVAVTADNLNWLCRFSTVQTTGGQAFIQASGSAVVSLNFEAGGTVSGKCYEQIGAGSVMLFNMFNSAAIGANTVACSGGAVLGGTFFVFIDSESATITAGQAGVPGGVVTAAVTLATVAAQLGYTDAAPLFNATQVQAAIDAIKTREYSTATALTDADQTLTVAGGPRFIQATALTAARVKTLGTTGAVAGNVINVARKDGAAFTLTVNNGGGGAGTLGVITASKNGFVRAIFDGTNWQLDSCGVSA